MKSLSHLEEWVLSKGIVKFRAKQIYQAVAKELISDWHEAKGLPKDLQDILVEELPISELKVKTVLPAPSREQPWLFPANANTVKIAFETHDKLIIESVLMRHEGERNTVCVSTQVGCPMNCAFCATGKMGLTRNLTSEEIVDQVLEFSRILKPENAVVKSVVFMGMGEPFLNYENVMEAIKILNDGQGFNLGIRHITISTSGIVPEILRFADEKVQIHPAKPNNKIGIGSGGVNLAISLHAPNNEIRNQLMPVNKKYPLEKLLPAISNYMEKTGRKVFFEYILLKGINDSKENIEELIDLMRKYFPNQFNLVHINLIEYNETDGSDFQSPNKEHVQKIFDLLQKNKILSTIRYRFGDEISAACGQLAACPPKVRTDENKV